MSFRKYGGTNFNAKHNNVSSHYNNTNNLSVNSGVASFDYMYISNLITANGGITGPTGSFEYVSGGDGFFENVTISGTLTYGELSNATGSFENVYISDTLTVDGVIYANGGITGATGSFEDIYISDTLAVDGVIYANGGITCATGSFENVYISDTLTVDGLIYANGGITGATGSFEDIYISGTLTVDGLIYANGGITGATGSFENVTAVTYNSTSDYRIKENIQTLDEMYTLDSLRPVSYMNKIINKPDIGLIADELQEIYPFMVSGEKDGEQLQTVNYISLIGIMIKEIKELKKDLSLVKKEIIDLKK